LALFAVCGLVLFSGCQRDGALRIVSINGGKPLMSDIIDFGELRIPSEEPGEPPEIILIYQYPEDMVEMELQYVEFGLGLPTWTPYQARINKIQISYSDATGTFYDPIVQRANIEVRADPDAKTSVKTTLSLVPAYWKTQYFADEAQDDPYDDEYGEVATLTAKVVIEGIDDASKKTVKAEGFATVIVGNWWDEPSRLNQ